MKALAAHPAVQTAISALIAGYLKLVWASARVVVEPADGTRRVAADGPVILAMWHGEHLLTAAAVPRDWSVRVLISTHRDGEINARVVHRFGIGTLRGSGTHDRARIHEKRSAAALRDMIRALDGGHHVALTADVPKVAKIAGLGVVTLARLSGRPIVPIALAASRRIVFAKSWDETKLPLPFARIALVIGDPIRVGRDDDADARRIEVERALDAATKRAYALADGARA